MQKAQTRAHYISQQVLDHIRSNSLQPGDQLPTESDMAVELGINRSTLREVYVQMLSEGLIVRQHGRGTFVGGRRSRMVMSAMKVSLGASAQLDSARP